MTASRVLVVDDEPDIRHLVKDILEDEGYEVDTAESAEKARGMLRSGQRPDLVLLDIWMPEEDGITLLKEWCGERGTPFPVVMISGHGTVETAVEATRLGAVDFVEKPLSMGKLLATVEQALAHGERSGGLGASVVSEPGELVGRSHVMRQLREQARRVAATESWVLVSGEAGSGKKCFARHLHAAMPSRAPFVEVAGGAISGPDAAEELFGVEREGHVRRGRLETAGSGMLVIDEVADMDDAAQRRLLSAIEAGGFQRVGGTATVALAARVVTLTRKDLAAEVAAGRFREDLYFHLSVVPINMPPLRDHVEDIPELLTFYVDWLVEREGLSYRRFSVAAQNRLRNHPWPGNVRELRNLVQRLLVLGEGLDIEVAEVEQALTALDAPTGDVDSLATISLDLPLREAREAFERVYLQHQLRRAQGSVAQLARLTGMERTHLYRKLRALGIDPKEVG